MPRKDVQKKTGAELAALCFSEYEFSADGTLLNAVENVSSLAQQEELLSYMQTIFFEERMVEVVFRQQQRLFFTTLLDDDPERLIEDDSGDDILDLAHLSAPGCYLQRCSHLLLAPLNPGIGNALLVPQIPLVLRTYFGATKVEFACCFRDRLLLGGEQVLRCDFPQLALQVKDCRPFRARAASAVPLHVEVSCQDDPGMAPVTCPVEDISVGGISFEIGGEHALEIEEGMVLELKVLLKGHAPLQARAIVRNCVRARKQQGILNTCGVQFAIENQSLVLELENLTATVQRLFLREISKRVEQLDGVSMVR